MMGSHQNTFSLICTSGSPLIFSPKKGQESYLINVKEAHRIVPVHPEDQPLLGVH